MNKIDYFFKENKVKVDNIEVIVSDEFIDDDKKPIPWIIRQIGQKESEDLREAYTIIKRDKRSGNITNNFKDVEYTAALIAKAVVYPNLTDKKLLDNYKVVSGPEALKRMLTMGEYATLSEAILEHNGLDSDEEIIEAAKNS